MAETVVKSPLERPSRIEAHISMRLREARAGLDITQAQLGARVGWTQAAISLWESGARRIGIAELDSLATALGKPLSFFLDWPNPMDGEPSA